MYIPDTMTPIKLVLDQGVQRNEALKKVSFTALKGREGANGLKIFPYDELKNSSFQRSLRSIARFIHEHI